MHAVMMGISRTYELEVSGRGCMLSHRSMCMQLHCYAFYLHSSAYVNALYRNAHECTRMHSNVYRRQSNAAKLQYMKVPESHATGMALECT